MKRSPALVIMAVLALAGCSAEETATPRTSIEDGVDQSAALMIDTLQPDEPGCSAAVALNGTIVWQGARGMADTEAEEPLTESSVFDFASVSKQFTATAILLLENDGALSLIDPVSRWVRDLPSWGGRMTVADLMHHRSGLPDYTQMLLDMGRELSDRTTQADALREIAAVAEPLRPPGTEFEYSNSNYVLLAEVVEAASGAPLDEFLQSRVFGPHDLELDPQHGGAVVGHSNGVPVRSAWEQIGDGSVYGTPAALAAWADYYRAGVLGESDLTGRATADAAPTGNPDGSRYGAGVMIGADDTLSHIGAWAGSVTLFGVSADRATTIVVSCNSTDAPADRLAQGLRTIWT